MADINPDDFKMKGFDFEDFCRQFLYQHAPELDGEDFDEAMEELDAISDLKSRMNKETLRELLSDVMNLGMKVRQDQLNGYGLDKSGEEILDEFIEEKGL